MSDSCLAGMSATWLASVADGFQVSSRMARRYRSVASRVTFSPSISMRTPVRIGNVSPRSAAIATWATAWVNTSPAMVPLRSGATGRVG